MNTRRRFGPLRGASVFLSASIPDPARWEGWYDALEITDAVVAVARAVLGRGGTLVTAAHPTIAPLILYVAAEQKRSGAPAVRVYQSSVFDPIMPPLTSRFEALGVGTLIRTPAVKGEPADPALAPASLARMRQQMLSDTAPIAAVFIGGMRGIPDEYALFRELRPGYSTYAFAKPGGSASALVERSPEHLWDLLRDDFAYTTIANAVVSDIERSIAG